VSTYSPKPGDLTRNWHVIDANDVVLGRLAVTAATLLRGKHKATYAPHMDGGDFVVIVNASKISLSGKKRTDKMAHRHSGRPGGLRSVPYGELIDNDPRKAVELAVWGMLPKNRLSRKLIKKLKVYAGPEHPHTAQQPQVFQITQIAQ
jgi:large subunit ribosomal protein L13